MDWLGLLEFALKLGATAAVVVVTCMVVERAGPVVGGLIAAIPTSSAPGFVFLAMEHDAAFIGGTAIGGMRAVLSTVVFIAAYGLSVPPLGLARGFGVTLLAWVAVVAAPLPASIWTGAALFALGMAVALFLLRRIRRLRPALRGKPSRWDIPARAAGAMGVVTVTLAVARLFGPAAAGIAAMAPLTMSSLGLMLYPRLGGAGAAAVIANSLPGIIGNAVALLVLNATAVRLGSAAALALAFAICVAWNAGLIAVSRVVSRRAKVRAA